MRIATKAGALTLVLILCVAALKPQNERSEEEARGEQQIIHAGKATGVAPPLNPAQSPKYKAPCTDPENRESCELEAQWQAADAAHDNVVWIKWQTFVSAVGLLGLLITLFYTRRATKAAVDAGKDAGEALKAARQSAAAAQSHVEVSRAAYERDLRAYLGIASIDAKPSGDGDIAFKIDVKNFGRTPAHKCIIRVASVVAKFPSAVSQLGGLEFLEQGGDLSIQPSASFTGYSACTIGNQLAEINAGNTGIYLVGKISYRDAEGIRRETNFAYRGTESSLLVNFEMHPCLDGNSAN